MRLTRIVVHAENDRVSEARVHVAAAIAAEHNAALVGLVASGSGEALRDGVPLNRDYDVAIETEQRARSSDATLRFRRTAAATLERSSTIEVPSDAISGLLSAALTADLVVVGQDPGRGETGESVVTPVVLGSSCPVLVVPRDFVGTFSSRRILIGWKDTVPTARALAGALPLLERARAILLAHVNEGTPPRPGAATLSDAAAWLERQGVACTTRELAPDPDDAGHGLLDEADRFGADLIVAGAWAKSPLRERMLGGATATLLAESELPLLLAH